MNIETVNELIQSLESAGELSIKESKYLELAKAYQQLAAENVVRQEFVKICFRAAADGASLDSSDIQEIGECLGLFGRETYQPMLHGYICGHEAGEDSVYVMKSAPATDAYLAGIKADGVEERKKTITFTAAKKLTQDCVALIAIGKPYQIHKDDVIGEFFIGEAGRYAVITMGRLNYFATSEEYEWKFSLREGAK